MTTYFDFNNNIQDHKYIFIIDDHTYKANNTKELIQRVEEDFNLTGVKHWIRNSKIPNMYKDKFDYVALNGKVIHDAATKQYKFNVFIDGKTYSNDLRIEVIRQIEEEYKIAGVERWFITERLPQKYHDMFNIVKINDVEIYNKENRRYKQVVVIDGVEYKANLKSLIINEIEEKYNINRVSTWFTDYRLPKSQHGMFKEVIVNGEVIYPKEKRGFL